MSTLSLCLSLKHCIHLQVLMFYFVETAGYFYWTIYLDRTWSILVPCMWLPHHTLLQYMMCQASFWSRKAAVVSTCCKWHIIYGHIWPHATDLSDYVWRQLWMVLQRQWNAKTFTALLYSHISFLPTKSCICAVLTDDDTCIHFALPRISVLQNYGIENCYCHLNNTMYDLLLDVYLTKR